MQAIIEFWNGLGPRWQIALISTMALACKDWLSFGRSRAEARESGKALPRFEWAIAVPTWALGFMGGFGVGTGLDTLKG